MTLHPVTEAPLRVRLVSRPPLTRSATVALRMVRCDGMQVAVSAADHLAATLGAQSVATLGAEMATEVLGEAVLVGLLRAA